MFASFSDQFTKDKDYFETTSTFDIIPFCLMMGMIFKLSNSFRLGPLIEYTLWLANGGNYRIGEGTFLSKSAMESIYGDRTRQLARVRPTGPHPAIITCVVIFCICYVSYWVPTDLIRFDQICIITRQIMPNRKLSNQYYYYNKITMNR